MLISYALPVSARDGLNKPFLSGRKAIVTGSTAGVGLAIARALVRAGAEVVVNGRKAEAVERAVAGLSTEPGAAAVHGVACDVGNTGENRCQSVAECGRGVLAGVLDSRD